MAKLDVKALGLSVGITWGVSVMLMDIVYMVTGWGGFYVNALGKLYTGYGPTVVGCLIGGAIGFIDMGIFSMIIAWLYNKFAK